jgi:hypothetical protein
MMRLSEFIKEEKESLDKFQKWWLEQSKKSPDKFPLQMEDGNEGAWFEQLQAYKESVE